MTKTFIGVRIVVEGFHNFPSASEIFGPEVKFLESKHRHKFGITLEVAVNHDNRDKEFFILQREVEDYINRNYGKPAEFGACSCEMIARDLMEAFNATKVIVDEDGENYSKIIAND